MKKEELIKKLEELPEGTEVCVFDWKASEKEAGLGEDGNSVGVYEKFDVELIKNENNGYPNWCALSFEDTYSE